MPLAGEKVAVELVKVCSDETCPHLIEWLGELYTFRQMYLIYQEEIAK
jgi:hypothetical protein